MANKSPAPSLNSQTLGDGRLSVGTHMPLLAKRYSYLSVIGEGASAQVSTVKYNIFIAPATFLPQYLPAPPSWPIRHRGQALVSLTVNNGQYCVSVSCR